jgi:hypothetical protein
MNPFAVTRCSLSRAIGLLVAAALVGCQQTSRDLPLDQDVARSACERALMAWQEGKAPADLKPEIVVGDHDWKSGRKLVAFEMLPEDEFNDGTNLHIPVRLTLQDDTGKESSADALYVVGTSPVITVFRD